MSSVFSIIIFPRGYDESEYKEGHKYREYQGSHKFVLSDFQTFPTIPRKTRNDGSAFMKTYHLAELEKGKILYGEVETDAEGTKVAHQ